MKLYTEEQLHNTVIAVSNYLDDINLGRAQENIKKYLKELEPIEVPTYEEIEKMVGDGMHDFYKGGFQEGAKWMRDKIKGGNK